MTTYVPAKKNTEYIFYMGLVSRSTGQFQANPTLAAGDFKVSIDGGALANLGTLPAVTPAASKMVKVTLAAAEMNGDNITVVASDAAGAEWDDVIVNIQTSTLQINDLATPTNITAGTITTVTNLTNAPTNGDLTAAMKASVNAEADTALADYGALKPTTAGRTLDVTATGEAGIDWANIGGATTTQNLSGTTVKTATDIETDTQDIQSRIPAALSANGNIKADLKEIDEQTTNGNNATLKLKKLDIQSSDTNAVLIKASGQNKDAVLIETTDSVGFAAGVYITASSGLGYGSPVYLDAQGGGPPLGIYSNGSGVDGVYIYSNGGKSINALQGIFGSDGEDLSVTNIVDKDWDEATAGHATAGTTGKALTDAGSAGDPWSTALPGAYGAGTAGDIIGNKIDAKVSDVKAKTDQLTFTNPGEVDANIQAVNDTELTGDGSTTPWGPV